MYNIKHLIGGTLVSAKFCNGNKTSKTKTRILIIFKKNKYLYHLNVFCHIKFVEGKNSLMSFPDCFFIEDKKPFKVIYIKSRYLNKNLNIIAKKLKNVLITNIKISRRRGVFIKFQNSMQIEINNSKIYDNYVYYSLEFHDAILFLLKYKYSNFIIYNS